MTDTPPLHLDTGSLGATPAEGGVHFAVWAPTASTVSLVLDVPNRTIPLVSEPDGTWHADVPGAGPGTRYRFQVDGRGPFPDPYSRFQPLGVHGPSEVVDLRAHAWQDSDWRGVGIQGLTIYELHVGTATPEGTFDALTDGPFLEHVANLGVAAVEVMPVAEFSGQRNWGYDGVLPFAVTRAYGGPAAFQRFVDAAHARGLGVILDVVYNHFGPEGNYLREYSPHYFTDRHTTPWGDAVNYDGENLAFVRRFVVDNAVQWVRDFHVDGLRLDAAHEIRDDSPRHLLAEITDTVRAVIAPLNRQVVLTAETDQNDVRFLRPVTEGGLGLDAVWADDFHHVMRRYLAGDHEGYYADYQGTLEELVRVFEGGWLYQGQPRPTSGEPRGTPAPDVPASGFIWCLQNHDQVGNRPFGDRLHHTVDVDRYLAASAVFLLAPYTPLLWMGQELAASSPFQYFTDHSGDLGRLVTEGRRKEFGAFEAFGDPETRERIPDPQAESTFSHSKLHLAEAAADPGARVLRTYRALLRLRREDPIISAQDRSCVTARVLGPDLLAVVWNLPGQGRVLVANFGDAPAGAVKISELLAAGEGTWRIMLDTSTGSGASTTAGGRVSVPPCTAVLLGR